jgi:hypothetical protein
MAEPRPWIVLPHDPIVKHADNLWSVVSDVPGMALRRRMTLARLRDGRVVVHNAVAVDEATVKAIEAWGAPSALLVPNGFHRLDAHAWKARFAASKVYCPAGATKRVADQVAVDGPYEAFAGDDTVRLETLDGTGQSEGVMVVTGGDAVTLVFNDVLFNQPHLPGFGGFMMKYVTDSTGGPKVTRIARLFLVKERVALQAHLLKLANLAGLARLIPGHGDTVEGDAVATLRAVANSL